MIASDGKIYRFLLQFAVPYFTRTDERSSQTHFVLDKILRKVFVTSRAHLSVQSHSVVPVAQRLRLISEPDGRTSLDEVYRNNCTRNGIDHTVLGKRYNEEIKKLLEEKSSSSLGDDERRAAEKAVRREAYSKICSAEEADDMILANHLLSILKGPEPLYHFRRVFTQQWAANCLLQYAFSAAERTPSRVVFLESDGRVLSSEFRIAYGSQGYIENPQALPFRLTPNIHSLIGFPLLDARFIASIAKIASAVYECRDVMDPVLRLLMRDDIVAFYTKAMAKSDSKTIEMERQLVDRVSRNVTSIHARFSQCGIKRSDKKEEPVDQNVRDLVDAARSKDNLCMMSSSYQAWL
jgi:transformation/transcription domain-associated protein